MADERPMSRRPSTPSIPPRPMLTHAPHARRAGLPAALLCCLLLVPIARAQEPVDAEANAAIRRHGLEESQVMALVRQLTDGHGPRLTGSPQLAAASQWAVEQFTAWGLADAHLEPWGPFGRGWTLNRFSMHAHGAADFPVHAYPKAWSGSTDGPVTGEVVLFDAEDEAAWAQYAGQLQGKIVMIEPARTLEEPFEAPARRRTADELLDLANATGDRPERSYTPEQIRRYRLQQQRFAFLYGQQPLAILDRGYRGAYGTIFVQGASVPGDPEAGWGEQPSAYDLDAGRVIPQITVATEHYNRLHRLLEAGQPVTMTLDLGATYHPDDPMQYNVVAEIPGTDPQLGDEVVMAGAHLDSWHGGTGATDNAAGVAVMMEAARILQAVFEETGRRPRRTIRIALWTGEEQGLFGSRAYVHDHFAELAGWSGPPTRLRPEHDRLSAYYNLDNGTGKIRGIYLQQNEAVAPIFRAWLAPFHDLGAATLTLSNTGSTDHVPFDGAGLPGFQFIQDHIAYGTRTHHSTMDVYDHVVADDLKQAATIVASFLYHTAQRDGRLPRKPLQMAAPEGTRLGSSN